MRHAPRAINACRSGACSTSPIDAGDRRFRSLPSSRRRVPPMQESGGGKMSCRSLHCPTLRAPARAQSSVAAAARMQSSPSGSVPRLAQAACYARSPRHLRACRVGVRRLPAPIAHRKQGRGRHRARASHRDRRLCARVPARVHWFQMQQQGLRDRDDCAVRRAARAFVDAVLPLHLVPQHPPYPRPDAHC